MNGRISVQTEPFRKIFEDNGFLKNCYSFHRIGGTFLVSGVSDLMSDFLINSSKTSLEMLISLCVNSQTELKKFRFSSFLFMYLIYLSFWGNIAETNFVTTFYITLNLYYGILIPAQDNKKY